MTCTSQPSHLNLYVSARRKAETAATRSDRSIENLVRLKYEDPADQRDVGAVRRHDLEVTIGQHLLRQPRRGCVGMA
jgi:hypothetical protein